MSLLERYCLHCGAASLASDVACAACGTSLKITRPLDQKKSIAPPPSLRLAVHLQTLQLFNERYRIVRQIGVGGFGAVYEAADTWEPKRVAIKEISLTGLSAQEVIEATGSFNREVQMLSRLRHAGIPRMYEQSTDAEHWYLIMEFIAGKTLEETLNQASGGHLPLEQVLKIGVQVCSVLEYLHSQRPSVIFRDIKPANIMLTPERYLYLIDFGVARCYQPGRTRDTIAFGSPGYAAPEQYGRAQTTPLSDIYSLGALLYCMLSGDDPSEHPFHFPPLHLYGVDGMRELDELIQRMVSPDPARRPQRVRAELQRIQHMHYQSSRRAPLWIPPRGQTPPSLAAPSRPGSSTITPMPQRSASTQTMVTTNGGQQQQMVFVPPTSGTQTSGSAKQPSGRKTTRRRVLVGSAIAGGSLLSLGLIDIWRSHQGNVATNIPSAMNSVPPVEAEATPTAQTTENPPSTSSQQPAIPANGLTYWSPDLSYAAVFVNGSQELALYSVKKKRLLNSITPDTTFYGSPFGAWSPDSSQFFFYDNMNNGFVWNVQQNKQVYTLPQLYGLAAWSPDSQFLAATGETSPDQTGITLFLLRAVDGKQLFQTTFSDANALSYLAWSPDSRYLVFPSTASNNWLAGQAWSLEIWDMQFGQKAGKIDGLLPGQAGSFSYTLSGLAWSPDGTTIAVGIDNDIWLMPLAYGAGGLEETGSSILHAAATTSSSGFSSNTLTWSPNSRYLAISQDEDNGGLNVYAVSSGKNVLTVNATNAQVAVALTWSADSKSITTADSNNVLSTWKIG